jgi:hypothetical protein
MQTLQCALGEYMRSAHARVFVHPCACVTKAVELLNDSLQTSDLLCKCGSSCRISTLLTSSSACEMGGRHDESVECVIAAV